MAEPCETDGTGGGTIHLVPCPVCGPQEHGCLVWPGEAMCKGCEADADTTEPPR